MNDFFQQVILKNHPEARVLSTIIVSGGCINSAYKLETDQGLFFLKSNKAEYHRMFSAERKGLEILASQSQINTPATIDNAVIGNRAYLLTECIESGAQSSDFWRTFAEKLANQHRKTSKNFGLDHDNYIGKLAQSNTQHLKWADFFINERLTPQLRLAESNGYIDHNYRIKFERLFSQLPNLIPNEAPALLHGDLWSGNFMSGKKGNPVIFDPAVYYGHRETEIAFTHLFGGFSNSFYDTYQEIFPLEEGFKERLDIHNLYPLLVHVNLFGRSYLSGIDQTLRKFN